MNISFLSRGAPDQISGGYLYNRYLIEYLQETGVEVTYHAEPPSLASMKRADVVVVDSLVVGPNARYLLSIRSKLVLLLHMVPSMPRHGASGADLLKELYRRSRLVVTGDATLAAIRRRMGGEGLDAVKVEPGVPHSWRAKTGYAEKAEALLGVANYVRGKGLLRTLDTLHRLRDLPWTLTLHGNRDWDPGYFTAVADKVEALELGDRVELLGPLPHGGINERMLESDLLVHFSEHESYSMVTAEAIACGLPVLSYRTGNVEGFSRSGLVSYVGGCPCSPDVLLGGLIGGASYARLRRSAQWQPRTWEDVGREFLTCLDGA